MRNTFKHKAYAKINLALNVHPKDEGHLHNVDTLITNINIYDNVTIHKRQDNAINITYTNLQNHTIENDTAQTMAELLQQKYNTAGMDIYIEKHIPFGAGLGGSSADAAAVAVGMQELFQLGDIPNSLLLKVGSDVPYMYHGGTKRVQGKGDQIDGLPEICAYFAIIVCPGAVSTAQAYALFDEIGGEHCDIDQIINTLYNTDEIILCNSLQRAATTLNPNIDIGLTFLQQAGFQKVVMTGSGSGVLGMMKDKSQYETALRKLDNILPKKYQLYCSHKGRI